jgi:hypothetical protein
MCAAGERTVVLMLPEVDIAAMNLYLAEISAQWPRVPRRW